MKKIYIVSTYYHALISCVKQLIKPQNSDIIVTSYIPDGEILADRIKKSRLFKRAFYVGAIQEYKPKNKLGFIFGFHSKNAKLIGSQLDVNLHEYDEINIFHDDTWIAHYLKSTRTKYRLIEDSLDNLKSTSRTNFSYMLPNNHTKWFIKHMLGIGYTYYGYDGLAAEIEVNDADGLEIETFTKSKIVEMPRTAMFCALSEDDKKILVNIFMKDIPPFEPQKSIILLTQPLFADGYVKSEAEQLETYLALVKKKVKDETLVIKPHPRDFSDYSVSFPSAVILDKNMPVEILKIFGTKNFKDVITLHSSALKWIKTNSIQEEEK